MREQENEIIIDIFSDITAVPNVLLENFNKFKLSSDETLFLILLLQRYREKKSMSMEDIEDEMTFFQENTETILAELVDKGFLCLKKGKISLHCLFDKLREAWGWKEAKVMRIAKEKEMSAQIEKESNREFAIIYNKVEAEFGRPLSPIESDTVKDWYFTLHMPAELIYEALKRAVLNNKRSFQYIKKILLDWQGKGYRSVQDLEAERKENTSSGKKSNGKRQFRENQSADIFEDIFEVK